MKHALNSLGMTAAAALVLVWLAPLALAQDKAAEEPFVTLAQSRTKAELAVRGAREFLAKNDAGLRFGLTGADRARTRAAEAYRSAITIEVRKPDANLVFTDETAAKIQQLQTDWEDKGAREVTAIDAAYREASTSIAMAAQVYQGLAALENSFKDAGIDLTPLQASYEAVAKRVSEQLAKAQKALADAQALHKTWDARFVEASKTAPPKK